MANVHSVEPMASLYSAIRLAASAFPSALTRTPGSMACSLWSNADKTDLGSSDASGSTLKRRMVFSKRLGSSCMRSLSHAWRLAWLLRDSGREISYGGHVLPSSSLTRPWTHSSIGTCASESFFSPLTMSTSDRSASSTTPGVRSEVNPAVAADAPPPPPPPPPPPLPLPLVAAVPAPPPPIAALRACSAALAASKGSDPSSSSAGGSAIARCGGIEAGVVILSSSSSSLLPSSSVRVSVVVLVVVLVGDGASSSTTGLTGLPPPPPRPPRPPLLVGRACDALPLSVAAAGGGGGDLDTAARAAGLGADGGPGLGGTGFLPSLSVAILGAGFGLPFLSPEAVAAPSMASGNGAGSSPSSSDTTSSSSSDSEGFMSLAMRFERTRSLGHEAFPTFAALERLAQHAPQESSRVHARTLPHARALPHAARATARVERAHMGWGRRHARAVSKLLCAAHKRLQPETDRGVTRAMLHLDASRYLQQRFALRRIPSRWHHARQRLAVVATAGGLRWRPCARGRSGRGARVLACQGTPSKLARARKPSAPCA